jgi:taurine dioxygenase
MSAVTHIDSFQLKPIGGPLGAEVADLDVSCPLTASKFTQAKQVFSDHHMLCVQGQRLHEKFQVDVAQPFGELKMFAEKATKVRVELHDITSVAVTAKHLMLDHPCGVFEHNNGRRHADSSYRYIPSRASAVYRTTRYRRVLWRTIVDDAGPVLAPYSRQIWEAVG